MAESTKAKKDDTDKPATQAEGDSEIRKESQSQVDKVAMVSRTADGQAHQHKGYKVIGVDDDASEAEKAAAENRPSKS